jgi:hypothetical protein
MRKGITKSKLSIRLNPEILEWLNENYENKSKYIEWLIYQDLKGKDLLKKELYIL